jgi:3-oxoacyl-[acyl-carrier-protein] synthase I
LITGVGMVSPLGEDALATAAAIRAGIAAFREYEDYVCGPVEANDEPAPLVGAPLHDGPSSTESLLRAFAGALQDVVKGAALGREDVSRAPLFLSLPAPAEEANNAGPSRDFLRELSIRAGAAFAPESRAFTLGNAGVFMAVDRALAAMTERGVGAVLVGGVDSRFESGTLARLDAAGRLKTPRNPDGFLPGGCAVALLLETQESAARRGARALAKIDAPAFAAEERPLSSNESSTAAGITLAIRTALGGDARPVDWAIGDLNGERYRFEEWARARVRLGSILGGLRHLWHPADCIGDVGAATGGVLLGIGAIAFAKGYARADRALLFSGSDDGTRAAMVLSGA